MELVYLCAWRCDFFPHLHVPHLSLELGGYLRRPPLPGKSLHLETRFWGLECGLEPLTLPWLQEAAEAATEPCTSDTALPRAQLNLRAQ